MIECVRCELVYDPAKTPGGHCPRCLLSMGPATEPGAGAAEKWEPPSIADVQALLPDYEILGLIGRGGMGAVYKARQPSLDRFVAIKILPPLLDTLGVGYVERFKNEARLLAKLNHPGIVHVYDFGELPGQMLHFVMEYVDGTDVARLVASQGRLSPEHAASITADVCAALHFAHEAGVVHRDVKPANVLVARDGRIKVADFGLAKKTEGAARGATTAGLVMGTADYAAPESLTAGMIVDHRADLYAVGVMLYNMLTGEMPRGVFPPVTDKSPAASPRFDEIITKALQREPERRYQSADLMKSDVERTGVLPGVKQPAWQKAVAPKWIGATAVVVALGLALWRPWRPAVSPATTPAAAATTAAMVPLPVDPRFEDDRAAAEWAIAKGGRVALASSNTDRVPAPSPLPSEPFQVASIYFDSGKAPNGPVTDAELARYLPRLQRLKQFIITQTPGIAAGISDQGARTIATVASLEYVGLDGVRVSDRTIRQIAAMPQLSSLLLSHSPIRGDSLQPVAARLTALSLAYCDIDAAAWKVIASMEKLIMLRTPGIKVDDAMIEAVTTMKTLKQIGWLKDPANEAALARIKAIKPRLIIRNLPKWDATEPPPLRTP